MELSRKACAVTGQLHGDTARWRAGDHHVEEDLRVGHGSEVLGRKKKGI